MKIQFEIEIPDHLLNEEGSTQEGIEKQFNELARELKETQPDGTSFTMRVLEPLKPTA